MSIMKINLNGEIIEFSEEINLLSLLEEIGFDSKKVAVELNLEIVPKSSYKLTKLKEGDNVEIVHFIGGGLFK